MRRVLIGLTAIGVALGWLQLAPAFGFPVTAPAAMLDRLLGPHRDAGPAGWALLMLGEVAFVAGYFLFVEGRFHWAVGAFAYAVGAWLLTGAVLMPVIGLLQATPPPLDALAMRGNFFMLNLGAGAAVEALIGWLLFGAVLAGGRNLDVSNSVFIAAVGAALLTGALALWGPGLWARSDSSRVFEASVPSLPTGPAFISVLELPQPPGAVLGPHQHVPGFTLDVSGVATMAIDGRGVTDLGAGDATFTVLNQRHNHQNRAAVPFAIALALVLIGLTVGLVALRGGRGTVLLAAALVAGTVATVDPFMNDWYFIAVRAASARGGAMPVPAGHRTYESENLKGMRAGSYMERLTNRHLGQGESARFSGPAAIVVLDGKVSVTTGGRTTGLSAQSGITIAGGEEAGVRVDSRDARVLVIELVPASEATLVQQR